MGWVYMLRCVDGSYYVGSTRSLEAKREALIRGDYDALPWLSRGSYRR